MEKDVGRFDLFPLRLWAPTVDAGHSRQLPRYLRCRLQCKAVEDELLATTELAAPTWEAREQWIQALNEMACTVSRLFRRTSDKSQHVHSVDQQVAGKEVDQAKALGQQVLRVAEQVSTKDTQRV